MAKIEKSTTPKVGVIMGSVSDWETMKEACDVLEQLQVAFEKKVVSAHRPPQWLTKYAEEAEERGLQVIIAGAGGAAHLPGMVASQTILPVIGVPVHTSSLNGMDSLYSIVQPASREDIFDQGLPGIQKLSASQTNSGIYLTAFDQHPHAGRTDFFRSFKIDGYSRYGTGHPVFFNAHWFDHRCHPGSTGWNRNRACCF